MSFAPFTILIINRPAVGHFQFNQACLPGFAGGGGVDCGGVADRRA
jgi:hypothetical protein